MKYSIDKDNRLLIRQKGKKVSPKGAFKIEKNNRLIYILNEPAHWRRVHKLPSRIVFLGKWKLDENHDLVLERNEPREKKEGRFVFKGEIISSRKDALAFEIISRDRRGHTQAQVLELSGAWQADKSNRIIFKADKKGMPDTLTLEGSWQLDNNQQVTYNYEKTNLLKRAKISRSLTFEGFWQINEKNRLTYILSRASRSRFDFRAQIESPSLRPKEGQMKYRLGIGLAKPKSQKKRIVTLYGAWKFSRKGGLDFSMDYGKGASRTVEFGVNAHLNNKDEIIFSLRSKKGEPLGLNITFNRELFKGNGALAYLRLKNLLERNKPAVEAGVRIPF
ncbi:MAG: hypothetical protein PHE18_02140 [Candidatus Omnitrophica bacterium]|nr:hypothetical protein [Candidatus Omnitrophota bacterium]MDD5552652.1 hypothetical protein [Candidatus Omnitrophota bacterium]